MPRASWLLSLAVGVSVLTTSIVIAQDSAPAVAHAFHPDASVREVMASMISPSATALWDAVAVTVGENGEQEDVPKNDAEWAEVRRNAVMMAEATNLLLIEGRHIAPPGGKSANPGSELEPQDIETLVQDNWQEWVSYANDLHDVGLAALETVDERDPEALTLVGGDIDAACESCHLRFWYPNQ